MDRKCATCEWYVEDERKCETQNCPECLADYSRLCEGHGKCHRYPKRELIIDPQNRIGCGEYRPREETDS